ncbi:hypothetical protein E8E12_004618 [Didymella heteroderae]|uniref:Mis6-domain-containing protein n=1 Tax=Didymella heteroderae TaxID=1769908 RepID=A0A9P4WMP5_9PLEO|nr:hypothetical protein E8E12_004618 [Didymella heteroderae]
MLSIAEELPSLSDALESLHKASQTPAKQRTVRVSGVVDVICRHAFADGLDEDALETVVHIAARKTELDQSSVTTLIKNLYPAQRVTGDVVVTIVAALGQGKGKPSPGTQDSLVKWLALVHEIIEDANILSRLYGVLFGMLDMISIRHLMQNGERGGFKVLRHGLSKTKVSVLPDVHTYHATESSVTLEGIDTVEAFVERLDRIEPPGQLISFLTDPLLQKYVDLNPSPVSSARIGLWLATCLEDQITCAAINAEDSAFLAELLDGLLQHARYSKTLLPVVPIFLKEYLTTWNGRENVEAVLGLLAYVSEDSFEDVYSDFFAPAERALFNNGLSSYAQLAGLYTELLQHRVAVLAQQQPERRQPALNSPKEQFLKDFVSHFAAFSTSLLLSLPSGMGTDVVSSILAFWELLSTSSKPHIIPILLPPMHLVYYLMQSSSADVASRICGIIGSYKQAFDAHPRPVKHYYPSEVTDGLNWCLRDVYNFFWVARGLAVAEQKSVGMYCHTVLRSSLDTYLSGLGQGYTIGRIFNLSYNAWLTSMSSAAWRALEEQEIQRQGRNRANIKAQNGPVTQQSLESLRDGGISVDWDGANGYKVFVLHWLADRGLGGLRELMFATVTDLKTGRGSS